MTIKQKDIAGLKLKATDDEKGTIEGYLSVFGVRDSYNEVVVPGAFADSLARHRRDGTMPLMLWQHDPWEPVGVWDDLAEDGKGLYSRGRLLIGQNIPVADKCYSLLKAEALWGQSIGYREVDVEPAKDGEPRKLMKLDLMEGSIVSFPANRRAGVDSVKSEVELDAFNAWKRFEGLARKFRDGEPLPTKEFEEVLREAGFPRSMAVQIASVGYAKAIRSESEGNAAMSALLQRMQSAAKAFSH